MQRDRIGSLQGAFGLALEPELVLREPVALMADAVALDPVA